MPQKQPPRDLSLLELLVVVLTISFGLTSAIADSHPTTQKSRLGSDVVYATSAPTQSTRKATSAPHDGFDISGY